MSEIVIPKVTMIPIDAIKTDGVNPNRMSFEQENALKENILKFGFLTPVVTNEELIVADGEHRLQAAKELGMTEIPCLVLPIKEVDRKILRQVMNKLRGEHDKALDLEEFKYLYRNDGLEDLQKLLGADDVHLVQFLANTDKASLKEDDLDLMEAYRNPFYKVEKGEVWICGLHRVMCGDSTSKIDVEVLLKGEKPVLMVTDPPYGVNYNPKWRDEADKGGILGNRYPTRSMGEVMNDSRIDWSEAYALYNTDVAYVWHAGKYAAEVKDSLTKLDYDIVSQIIWVKPHFALSRGDYHWRHEPCWYAVKKGNQHNWQGSRTEDTVWEIAGMNAMGGTRDEADERTGHGTQKPVECMKKPIRNNSSEGDLIVDPFAGSGSTLIAAEQAKRKAYLMELDPSYVSLIIQRWEKITGLKAIKEESPIKSSGSVEGL